MTTESTQWTGVDFVDGLRVQKEIPTADERR